MTAKHGITISKDVGINTEKEICVPNKESINGHRCERTDRASKNEMYELQKANLTARQGILKAS